MGWLYYAPNQQALIEDLLQDTESAKAIRKVLAHKLIREGSNLVLWSVVDFTAKEDLMDALKAGFTITLICCDLIDCCGNKWGVKRLDESAGPLYYSCPLSFLDMAPERCASWRASVREFTKKAAAQRLAG